jgi:hypothetical protein
MSVVIQMDAEDFGRLLKGSADRAVMKISPGRFAAGRDGEVRIMPPDWDWTTIYWLGHDYAAVILARAFLAAYGYRYEVLWDTSAPMDRPQRGWCILTDYDQHRTSVLAPPRRDMNRPGEVRQR